MITSAEQVALARSVAKVAHDGQLRKGGDPFFKHPERVARKVGQLGADAVTVAYLHDVVEDTRVDFRTLRQLFVYPIVEAVWHLTRHPGRYPDYPLFPLPGVEADKPILDETYAQFVARTIKTGSVIALQVKLADLHDNMNDPAKSMKGKRYDLADQAIRAALSRRGVEPLVFG